VKPSDKLAALIGDGPGQIRIGKLADMLRAEGHSAALRSLNWWRMGAKGFDKPGGAKNHRLLERLLQLPEGYFSAVVPEPARAPVRAPTTRARAEQPRESGDADGQLVWRANVEAYLRSAVGRDTPGVVAAQLVLADFRAMQCDPQSMDDIHAARLFFQAKAGLQEEALLQLGQRVLDDQQSQLSPAWSDRKVPAAWIAARDEDYAKYGRPAPQVDERLAHVVHAKRGADLRGKTRAKVFREARVTIERELKS
jgi:hypothetical protein